MDSKKSFTIKLLYITAITELLSLGWWFFMPEEWVTDTIFVLPLFFLGLTMVIHEFLTKSYKSRFQNFLHRFMLVTTIKLLGLLAIITVYIFVYSHDAIAFVLTLFVNYLIFTFFEASALIKKSREVDPPAPKE
jgi:hypothetical protein